MYTAEQVQAKVKVLCETIKASEPYQALLKAKADIAEHTAAKVMLDDFREKQLEAFKDNPSEEVLKARMEEVRKLYEIISYNPYVQAYLKAELEFGAMMNQLQQTLNETLAPLMEEQQEKEAKEAKPEA